jgi:hypothetical protein
MSHLFKIVEEGQYASVNPTETVVKNITQGPFYVNDDGGWLPSMGVASIDASCAMCQEGITDGRLIVLHGPSEGKISKVKTKSIFESNAEVTQIVASAGDNGSVQ